jgi:hypothetical protein
LGEKKYKIKKLRKPLSPTLLNNVFVLVGVFIYFQPKKYGFHTHKGFLFKNFPSLLDLPRRQGFKS